MDHPNRPATAAVIQHITALPIASAISFCYAPTPWTPAIRRSVEQP